MKAKVFCQDGAGEPANVSAPLRCLRLSLPADSGETAAGVPETTSEWFSNSSRRNASQKQTNIKKQKKRKQSHPAALTSAPDSAPRGRECGEAPPPGARAALRPRERCPGRENSPVGGYAEPDRALPNAPGLAARAATEGKHGRRAGRTASGPTSLAGRGRRWRPQPRLPPAPGARSRAARGTNSSALGATEPSARSAAAAPQPRAAPRSLAARSSPLPAPPRPPDPAGRRQVRARGRRTRRPPGAAKPGPRAEAGIRGRVRRAGALSRTGTTRSVCGSEPYLRFQGVVNDSRHFATM